MKMVRSSGRFCLFSENKLQVHPFPGDWRTLLSSWIFQHNFHWKLLAGCGLLALRRRGAGVSKELGLLLHQAAYDRDLEGSSDPEKVPQPCHFQELPL